MANLADVLAVDFNNIFTIFKVGIGFAFFYFIFNSIFDKALTNNRNNKKIRSVNKNKINSEKIKPNIKVSLKK